MLDSSRHQPPRILLVDDHEASARALSRLLRSHGYHVTTAYTFNGALALAAAPGVVDLLICDVDLPDGNGCELLRRLRAFFGGRAIPGIAITGHDGWVEESARAGYGRFLHKPLQLDDVLEAIEALRSPAVADAVGAAPVLGGV